MRSLGGQGLAVRLVGFGAVLALAVGAPATANANLAVAPGASHAALPCTTQKPCEFVWAIEHATSGEAVQFRSGTYELDGSAHSPPQVPAGVTLEPLSGESRPLIKQTVAFASCSEGCATLTLGEKATLRDLALEQPSGALKEGSGTALSVGAGATVERAIITAAKNAVSFATGTQGIAELRDSLVVAGSGTAVEADNVSAYLDNVTAIAKESPGVALNARSSGPTATLDATNTIARGEAADVQVQSTSGQATVELHYCDARSSKELTSGAGASIDDSDHMTRAEPSFALVTPYQETSASPTDDAGTSDPRSGSQDLAAQSRSVGPATDIGAYEFQGAAPSALIGGAHQITTTSALISGTLNSEDGSNTTWSFNYGTTRNYGKFTSAQEIGTNLTPQTPTATLSGLTPGTLYHYQLVASNSRGSVASGDATFTTASTASTTQHTISSRFPLRPIQLTAAPRDSSLRLSPQRFRAASRGGTISAVRVAIGTSILYSDSQTATTTFTVLARVPGVRSGRSCIAPPSHRVRGRRYLACLRYVKRGSFVHVDRAGTNRVRFSGRLHSRKLPAGQYRLSATPRSAAGRLGTTLSASFTILS